MKYNSASRKASFHRIETVQKAAGELEKNGQEKKKEFG